MEKNFQVNLFSNTVDNPSLFRKRMERVFVIERSDGAESSYEAAENYKPPKDKVKKLGQVFTPKDISEILAIWALSNNPKRILDPAVGTGNLLMECRNLNTKVELYGIELDRELYEIAKHSSPKGTYLCNSNFLTARIEPFDSVVSNPPYVRFHYRDLKKNEISLFKKDTNFSFSRLTNIYCLFVAKIYTILSPRGRAAIILPSEFLNSNYGVAFKAYLQEYLVPSAILFFENQNSLFEENLTTSAIMLLDKSKEKGTPIPLLKVGSLGKLREVVSLLSRGEYIPGDDAEDVSKHLATEKWGNISAIQKNKAYPKCLKDFVKCKRGIATGSNDYFCLSISDIKKYKIPESNFIPCITKAQHANGLSLTKKDFLKLKNTDQKCYLFYPLSVDAGTESYINYGKKIGVNKKYLAKNRSKWYISERRSIGDMLIGVFFRNKVKCFRNYAGVYNLTCFHAIYAEGNFSELVVLFLNSKYGRKAIEASIRSYGAGLNKLEPRDVEAIPCPDFSDYISKNKEAKELIKKRPAQSEIDEFVASCFGLE